MTYFKAVRRRTFWLGALLAVASLVGCGTPPTYKLRPVTGQSPGTFSLAHSKVVEDERHGTRHLDAAKSIVYSQNFGGGGAALGLLLGPLGVAANISMIDSNTEADAVRLRGKLTLAPRELFLAAATQQGLEVVDDAAAGATGAASRTLATPYLFVSKTDNDRLLTAAAVRLEYGRAPTSGRASTCTSCLRRTSWTTWPASRPRCRPAWARRRPRASALAAFIAKEAPQQDGQAKGGTERDFSYKSDLLTPRIEIEMNGRFIARSGDLIWFRSFGGVYAVRTSNIKVMSGGV